MIAYASNAAGATQGNTLTAFLPLIIVMAAMYFFMIRPQSKRDKESKKMRDGLKPGDDIVTIGGIYGKIVRVTDDRVVIMVGSEKVKLEMAKNAINGLATPSVSTSSKSKNTEEAEAAPSKPTPKSIKKLGAKKEAEQVAETAEAAAEPVEAAAEKTEA